MLSQAKHLARLWGLKGRSDNEGYSMRLSATHRSSEVAAAGSSPARRRIHLQEIRQILSRRAAQFEAAIVQSDGTAINQGTTWITDPVCERYSGTVGPFGSWARTLNTRSSITCGGCPLESCCLPLLFSPSELMLMVRNQLPRRRTARSPPSRPSPDKE